MRDKEELREDLAESVHQAWSGWMKYMFGKCEPAKRPTFAGDYTMPAWAVERWQRQMNTPYPDLPESEKESDRAEADKMLEIMSRNPELPAVAAIARQGEVEKVKTEIHEKYGFWVTDEYARDLMVFVQTLAQEMMA